jgi:hypothetical protein
VADGALLELVHAEIDGELDAQQRGELAGRLLADPEARALGEKLRRLCDVLDGLEDVEPPGNLRQSILDALPQSGGARERPRWPAPRMRYAAVIVLSALVGAAVYLTVRGPKPSTTEVVGTIGPAGEASILDTVRLGAGPVAGRVSLYRDHSGLALRFELTADAPVDVLIATQGRTLRVDGVGGPPRVGQGKPAGMLTVGLPGLRMSAQKVELTFVMDGRLVGSATLTTPGGS